MGDSGRLPSPDRLAELKPDPVQDIAAPTLNHELPIRASTGAGEGNRTPITSLEGWSSTIELHPRSYARAGTTLVQAGPALFAVQRHGGGCPRRAGSGPWRRGRAVGRNGFGAVAEML